MKVLHIDTDAYSGGAARAAQRIHRALVKQGVDSYYYALRGVDNDKRLLSSRPKSIWGRSKNKIRFGAHIIGETGIKKVFHINNNPPFSLGMSSMLNRDIVEKVNPDVINLHWICNGFISIDDFAWLAKWPLVWTLHDSWSFTGGCHVPQECKKWKDSCANCELMGSFCGIDLAKYIFYSKKKYYDNVPLKIVGVSEWIAECARQSALLRNKEVFCVHNTLNQDVYKPKDKAMVRKILGLPVDKKIILFGAVNSTADENKGFRFLHEAIRCLTVKKTMTDLELMVFGSNEPANPPDFGAPIHYMGTYSDDIALSLLYSAADVMIVPSRSESFSNTVLESINCGTPVVAFRIGGIPDQIDHLENGYLAEPYDSYDLAKGIAYILEDKDRWQHMSAMARNKAVKSFSEDKISCEYISVYEKSLAGR